MLEILTRYKRKKCQRVAGRFPRKGKKKKNKTKKAKKQKTKQNRNERTKFGYLSFFFLISSALQILLSAVLRFNKTKTNNKKTPHTVTPPHTPTNRVTIIWH